jgi:hypothetical protein
MKRHLDNLEGAFPLLLIGSVLLVYAGIVASQQLGSHSSQLPLWGLLGGVGAVIVGAGVYSSFLEPEATPAPGHEREWVTVPRAEWESRTGARPTSERFRTSPEPVPIWWEGPPTPASESPSRAPPATGLSRTNRRPAPTPTSPVRAHPAMPSRAVPRPTARYSYRELTAELSELEALVYGRAVSTARTPPASPLPRTQSTPSCMDCDRPLTAGSSPSPCLGCGRGLCAHCTASSRAEDGEVRCVECRSRSS